MHWSGVACMNHKNESYLEQARRFKKLGLPVAMKAKSLSTKMFVCHLHVFLFQLSKQQAERSRQRNHSTICLSGLVHSKWVFSSKISVTKNRNRSSRGTMDDLTIAGSIPFKRSLQRISVRRLQNWSFCAPWKTSEFARPRSQRLTNFCPGFYSLNYATIHLYD